MPRIFPQPGQKFYELTRELTELGGVHNVDFWFDRSWDNEPMLEVADSLYEQWMAEHGDPEVQDKRASTTESDEDADDPAGGEPDDVPDGPQSGQDGPEGAQDAEARVVTRPTGVTETRDPGPELAQADTDADTEVPATPAVDETAANAEADDSGSADNASEESAEDTGSGAKRTAKKNSTRR